MKELFYIDRDIFTDDTDFEDENSWKKRSAQN